ncbi:MAG: polyribonucleotide nucleotidyltransferase [Victivallales bacterium]|nr:polyribonucleotide nucleotidyltransferase [Victivallales bacterium]
MADEKKVVIELAPGKTIEISTGKMANLANGSCILKMGDTQILVTACSGPARPGSDFFPLQVDYREKYCSAGKFPGGFIKREGRPSDKEILTCRMTDRPIRPLFPKGFFDEVQVQALTLSCDGENDPDVLCMLGSSAALMLSDLPFMGPIGSVRIGMIDGEFVVNPTRSEMAKSRLELIYSGIEDKVIMIEGESDQITEQQLEDAMRFANEIVKKMIAGQIELSKIAGKAKKEPTLHLVPANVEAALYDACKDKIEAICIIPGKAERCEALDALRNEASVKVAETVTDLTPENLELEIRKGFDDLVKATTRKAILEKNYRPDGRGLEDLRPVTSEVGLLPVVHGSGLFSRGETQALVIVTLGGDKDSQTGDSITGEAEEKKFYLHYNFPNYSVGEVGRIMGPGRREIGHGNLAERSVKQVVPKDFPYTIRCVSEVMSSNGSTSMASVCGATLAMMDAGVPIVAPVAGISCGLVTDEANNKELLLTDIIGAEDHFGDMDFKVCGTRTGITGFQLDLKLPGISIDLLAKAMVRNNTARMQILDNMETCISAPRAEISPNAPQMAVMKINPEKIGALIGPGGKNIKGITEETNSEINIDDDGTVKIYAKDMATLEKVKYLVDSCTAEAEIGKLYRGTVKAIKDFGAFVEFMPGQEGLLHISEMADYRVNQVTDICNVDDKVTVKVLDIDQNGRVRLSRKAALAEMDK